MNVLIVDTQPLLRRGIIQVLSSIEGQREYFESETIKDALKKYEENKIDVIFTDLHLSDGSGLDLIDKIKDAKEDANPKIVLLADFISIFEFNRAKNMQIEAYILKDSDVDDLKFAYKLIMKGEKYYPHKLVEKILNGRKEENLRLLTVREMDVLIELSKGLTNSQIGNNLFISEGTAKKHISSILTKLNMSNRMEVLVYAHKLAGKQ